MQLKVLVGAGDGIGPEVTREALRILVSVAEFGGYDFQFTEMPIGGVAIRQTGTPLPATTLDAALESDAVLLGAVGGNEFIPAPDRRPEAGLLQLRQPWLGSPTCALPLPIRPCPPTLRCGLK